MATGAGYLISLPLLFVTILYKTLYVRLYYGVMYSSMSGLSSSMMVSL